MRQFKCSNFSSIFFSTVVTSAMVALSWSASLHAAEQPAEKSLPAPHDAKGHILISREPGETKGLWMPDYRIRLPTFDVAHIAFKPWAKGLYDARQAHDLEPHARCKPSGGIRQFLTPYGVEILELPELQRLYIFDIGGPHTFREVYMDGRAHPADFEPTYYGHSVGRWEGDTLVIDSVGYNTDFWFERSGLPHTESVHVVEYLTRTDKDNLDYRFVMEDPKTYDKPVEGQVHMRWGKEEELFEYMCQQSNYAADLMVDEHGTAVGKKSSIIP